MRSVIKAGYSGLLAGAIACAPLACGTTKKRSPGGATSPASPPAPLDEAPPPPPADAVAAPPPSEADVSGGETSETVIFDSSRAPTSGCREQETVIEHVKKLFAAVHCFEQNHTTAGRRRLRCDDGWFLITPREEPDGAAFSITAQWTGNILVPFQAIQTAPQAWLKACGFQFPSSISNAAAESLYIYRGEAACWNVASCPKYCQASSKFLSASKAAAVAAGCKALEDATRVMFTCQGRTTHANCQRNLDGELARFNLQERDAAHQLAFTITYRGNAVETCDGTTYGPANNESPLFGPGFPNFLVAVRDECRPH